MSEDFEDSFVPQGGKLGQMIHENPGEGVDASLRFFIELSFPPFEWEDETLTPLLRVDNISVEAMSWKALEGQVFEFPWAPKPGSVEAAVLLFGEHNPADVTKIAFGKIDDGKIEVSFETEIDFEIEADRDDIGTVSLSFDLPLEVEPLRVATSLEKRCQSNPVAITEAVEGLVDLDGYGAIEKVPGGFVFPVA